ncbi:hypothetical protein LINPERPRIM_LOCUS908 [Linum perenne]
MSPRNISKILSMFASVGRTQVQNNWLCIQTQRMIRLYY